MYYIYFLESIKNYKVYVGITENDPKERLKQHNQGSNIWTKQNGPFKLLYYESYICKQDAKSREIFYKNGLGRKIRNLIIKSVSAKGGPASGGG